MSEPANVFPESWYHAAMSADLPVGSVLARQICGEEIVLFRTESGRVGALDAHCPHLGAHLGHGGRVLGEVLRCPFHALHWATDGRCAGADDTDAPGMAARARAWPVHELHGAIMLYYHPERIAPTWRIPDLDTAGWSDVEHRTIRLSGHVIDVAENGVDRRHFQHVHGYSNVSDFEVDVDGATMHVVFQFDKGGVRSTFDTLVHGLGYAHTDLRMPDAGIHARVILLSNQVDPEMVDFTIAVMVEGGLPWIERFVDAIEDDVKLDLPIWAHKRRLEHPALIPSDGPIGTYRRFVRRFLPAPDGD